jgi:hypothetical protein
VRTVDLLQIPRDRWEHFLKPIVEESQPRAVGLHIRQGRLNGRSTSVLTSLIATCIYAGVNAAEYLVALQKNRREVFLNPAAWLPWPMCNGLIN